MNLSFEEIRPKLDPKQLAALYIMDKRYFDYEEDDQKQIFEDILKNGNSFRFQQATETTKQICQEMLRLMDQDPVLFHIKNHDLEEVIKLKDQWKSVSTYIAQAYEANFTEFLEFIANKEDSYIDYGFLLANEKNYKLFDYMVSITPKLDKTLLMFLVANYPWSLDHVLKMDQFSYYLTYEGILEMTNNGLIDPFTRLINHPLIAKEVLEKVLVNMSIDKLEHIKAIFQTRKCEKDLVVFISKLIEKDEFYRLARNYIQRS